MEARPQVPLINKWAPRLLPTKRPSSITCPPTLGPQPTPSTHHQYNPFKTSRGRALPPPPISPPSSPPRRRRRHHHRCFSRHRLTTLAAIHHGAASRPPPMTVTHKQVILAITRRRRLALHTLLAPRRPGSPAITIQ